MPFAGQAAGIAAVREMPREGIVAVQETDGLVPLQLPLGPGVFPGGLGLLERVPQLLGQDGFVQVALGQPVVHPVLGGDFSRENGHTGGGTDRGGAERAVEPGASGGQLIQVGRADFAVPRAAHPPMAVVVGEDEQDVGTFGHLQGSFLSSKNQRISKRAKATQLVGCGSKSTPACPFGSTARQE